MNKNICKIFIIICVNLFGYSFCIAETDTVVLERLLPIEEFIKSASINDTVFEDILIDNLDLKYEKALTLPAKDLVMSVKAEYDMFLDQDRNETEVGIGLDKLFPNTGTEIKGEYITRPSYSNQINSSQIDFSITQPIAQNAFGKSTRLLDKITGLGIDIAKYQITEAYEDYFAVVIKAYYDWYEAYQSVLIGESSFKENIKLLDNVKQRKKSKIAVKIDVNKTNLQLLSKKERLVKLREDYEKKLNIIKVMLRYKDSEMLIPEEPKLFEDFDIAFEKGFESFQKNSRTFKVLSLLEEQGLLSVDYNANDLLPSIDMYIGYNTSGDDYGLKDQDSMVFTGLSAGFPFTKQKERASYEQSKIALDRVKLSNQNIFYDLYVAMQNLSISIDKQNELIEIADEKNKLAKDILSDETYNYTYGKVTLNDYIDAVNNHDANRFNFLSSKIALLRLKVEWLRLTDKLVSEKVIDN